jgi:hypothetical protein
MSSESHFAWLATPIADFCNNIGAARTRYAGDEHFRVMTLAV